VALGAFFRPFTKERSMQIFRTAAELAATDTVGPELSHLIAQVFANVSDCPEILGFILVVETGDTIANIDAVLRFPILANRHEFILEHANWYELVYVFGQDGAGLEVFVPKSIDMPDLLAMCMEHALPAESTP
jgi:hypothetical protein